MNNKSQNRKKMLKTNSKVAKEELVKLSSPSYLKKDASFKLLVRLAICMLLFIAGIVTGLVSSNQKSTLSLENYTKIYSSNPSNNNTSSSNNDCSSKCEKIDCMKFDNMVHPKELKHELTDDELFWRASMVPRIEGYPFKRVPKLAFMFLTRGPLPLLPLWERFFSGHQGLFSIYVHTQLGYVFDVASDSVFFRRQIPSKVDVSLGIDYVSGYRYHELIWEEHFCQLNQEVSWGDVSLADAEKRLLANALLDFSNERFVLLSESCIPIYDFQTVYKYLTESTQSFVESYDDQSRFGRGRYDRHMRPSIVIDQWRKGAQWFEMSRALAIEIISDYNYYDLFRKYCHPPCFPDEHYIPTYLNIFNAASNSNRTTTLVDWSLGGPHPTTFVRENITEGFLQNIRIYKKGCLYNSKTTNVCHLFARKFDPSALEPLLDLSSKVMGF